MTLDVSVYPKQATLLSENPLEFASIFSVDERVKQNANNLCSENRSINNVLSI